MRFLRLQDAKAADNGGCAPPQFPPSGHRKAVRSLIALLSGLQSAPDVANPESRTKKVLHRWPVHPACAVIITDSLPLTAGTRLGPYEILSAQGAGGMGEVYRAPESKHPCVRDIDRAPRMSQKSVTGVLDGFESFTRRDTVSR
jgi:hypothetical protein